MTAPATATDAGWTLLQSYNRAEWDLMVELVQRVESEARAQGAAEQVARLRRALEGAHDGHGDVPIGECVFCAGDALDALLAGPGPEDPG